MDRSMTWTQVQPGRGTLLRWLGRGLGRGTGRALARMGRWQQLARERESLRHLDARSLRDIGISRHEAMEEARRPFWDDPAR